MTLEYFMAKLVLPEDSYNLMGILFQVHNELGPSCKEKNYQDAIEIILKQKAVSYEREKEISIPFAGEELKGFFADFIIDNKIILEVKAEKFIKNNDIRQALRYLKATNFPLAIVVNFKRQKLEYKRIINSHPNLNQYSSSIRHIRDELGKILSIDYGDKKVGLAKSVNNTAVPLVILENAGRKKLLKQIAEVCRREGVEKIIVGLPLSMSGTSMCDKDLNNSHLQKVLSFIADLKKSTTLLVKTEDERLSTRQAAGLLKGTKNKADDDVAAMVILQSYLDKN